MSRRLQRAALGTAGLLLAACSSPSEPVSIEAFPLVGSVWSGEFFDDASAALQFEFGEDPVDLTVEAVVPEIGRLTLHGRYEPPLLYLEALADPGRFQFVAELEQRNYMQGFVSSSEATIHGRAGRLRRDE